MSRIVWLAFVALLMPSCQTTHQPSRGNVTFEWQEKLRALRCHEPGPWFFARRPGTDSFAFIDGCRKVPATNPNGGYTRLVIVDMARGEVQAHHPSGNWGYGLHFAADVGWVWYSTSNVELYGKQRFVEAFALSDGAPERSLGRVGLPFAAAGAAFTQGAGCHALSVQNYRERSEEENLIRLFLVRDDAPFETSHEVAGVSRVLFWDARRQAFVVEPSALLDCAGKLRPVDAELARRLSTIRDRHAMYVASRTGDLLVRDRDDEDEMTVWRVFRGERAAQIGPFPVYACDGEMPCAPSGPMMLHAVWSLGATHILVVIDDEAVVFRADDLQVASRWYVGLDRLGAAAFLSERTVLMLGRDGRSSIHTW